jgi:hypothetical protein
MDSSDFKVYLYDHINNKEYIVSRHESQYLNQDSHPHPVLFGCDQYFIFTTEINGKVDVKIKKIKENYNY